MSTSLPVVPNLYYTVVSCQWNLIHPYCLPSSRYLHVPYVFLCKSASRAIFSCMASIEIRCCLYSNFPHSSYSKLCSNHSGLDSGGLARHRLSKSYFRCLFLLHSQLFGVVLLSHYSPASTFSMS